MTIYPEKRLGTLTGVWIAEITAGHRRERKRFESRQAGLKALAYRKATGAWPAGADGSRAAHPFGDVVAQARRERPEWKHTRDHSLDQRLEELRRLIGAETDVSAVGDAKVGEIVGLLETRRGRQGGRLSVKTINRYLAALSAVLTFAHARGWLGKVPTIPWGAETRGRLHYLTPAQEDAVATVLRKTGEEYALCLRVLCETALRPGEFFKLEPGQLEVVHGEQEQGWVRLWHTKTDRPRSVPLAVTLLRPLRRLIEDGGLPTHGEFYRALKAACAALGLPKELTVYSTRHTGGTRLAQTPGVNGPVIKTWMGHGSYRTTENYIHMADEDLLRAHAARQASGGGGVRRVA
jgi:integrase